MRPGGGKAKGGAFERLVCKQLSLWVTHGVREDVFWRSAISGGRATVAHKKGKVLNRQAGDICATGTEGYSLTERIYIECKFYKRLRLEQFLLHNRGPLVGFWLTTKREAAKYDRKPMLIARENKGPTLVFIEKGGLGMNRLLTEPAPAPVLITRTFAVYRFADILTKQYQA